MKPRNLSLLCGLLVVPVWAGDLRAGDAPRPVQKEGKFGYINSSGKMDYIHLFCKDRSSQ